MSTNNKVTSDQIKSILDNAETQEVVFWDKEVVVSYKLYNGFTIIGRGACVDPANFSLQIGRQVAREQAENKLWELLLQYTNAVQTAIISALDNCKKASN